MIKTIFAVLLFTILPVTSPVLAQDKPDGPGAPGCGSQEIKFDVQTNKAKHPVQPEPGKALVYFIENDSDFGSSPKPTTRIGIDGQWVGATHGNSWFYISVNPGVRHICANWQSSVLLGRKTKTAAAHFTAEAGGVYYFEARNTFWLDHGSPSLTLNLLDSDQGQLQANTLAFSIFHQKCIEHKGSKCPKTEDQTQAADQF